MKFKFLFLPFIVLVTINAYSQTEFYSPKTIDIRLYGGKSSALSFFDLDGNMSFEIPDKSVSDGQPERDYIFEYISYTSGVKAEYSPFEDLVLSAEMPLSYHSLTHKADTTIYRLKDSVDLKYDTLTFKKMTSEYSLFQPSYFSIGGRYKFYSRLAYAAVMAELRIPPGFHDGIQNDPDYEFLSDGAIEFHTGLLLGIKFEKAWLESSFSYHFRGEELVDYIKIHSEFGLTIVPGSKLGANLDFVQSLGNFNEVVEFEPKLTTLQENLLTTGFMFQLFISENFYIDFSFKVNLFGKNSMNTNGYFVGAGIRL